MDARCRIVLPLILLAVTSSKMRWLAQTVATRRPHRNHLLAVG